MMRNRISTLCFAVLLLAAFSPVGAQEWGDLTVRFVYDGPPPAAKKIIPQKDVEVCAKHPLIDESLVVGKDGGVANIVVYLRNSTGQEVPVHPDLAKVVPKEVKFDNLNCRFTPHILPLWLGHQTLILHNSDPVGHNTNIQPLRNTGINVLLPGGGGSTEFSLEVAESLPIAVACNIHPWMKGWILPRDNPYVGVSAADGTLKIEKLPAGEWTFQTWQEQSGYLNTPDWGKRGRFTMQIKPGTNDLGTIKLSPEIFEKN